MLENDDITIVDKYIKKRSDYGPFISCWERIKKVAKESSKTPTNNESFQLLCNTCEYFSCDKNHNRTAKICSDYKEFKHGYRSATNNIS